MCGPCKEYHEKTLFKVESNLAIIVLALNIFTLGWGTLLAGFKDGGEDSLKNAFIVVILFYLLCFLFGAGYLWCIYHGWLIYQKSK